MGSKSLEERISCEKRRRDYGGVMGSDFPQNIDWLVLWGGMRMRERGKVVRYLGGKSFESPTHSPPAQKRHLISNSATDAVFPVNSLGG